METYTFEIHDVKAIAKYEGIRFIVLKGSTAVDDFGLGPSFLERPENEGRRKFRKKLLQEGKLIKQGNKLLFTEDVQFNSPSQAATIIAGSNQDGPKVFGIGKRRPNTPPERSQYQYYSIESNSAIEGHKIDRSILTSHRNQELSKRRKKIDNYTCQACGFRLNIRGKFVIESHHLNPLSVSGEVGSSVDSLISLCPTCHRIAHMRQPPYSVEEIARIVGKNN